MRVQHTFPLGDDLVQLGVDWLSFPIGAPSVTVEMSGAAVLATFAPDDEHVASGPLDLPCRLYGSLGTGAERRLLRRLLASTLGALWRAPLGQKRLLLLEAGTGALAAQMTVPALLAASAALTVAGYTSNVSFGALRIGRVDGQWAINPRAQQSMLSDVDIVMTGTHDALLSLDVCAEEVSAEDIATAVAFGLVNLSEAATAVGRIAHHAARPEGIDPGTRSHGSLPSCGGVDLFMRRLRDSTALHRGRGWGHRRRTD